MAELKISGGDDFEAWLDDKSRDVCLAIIQRAVLRTVPYLVHIDGEYPVIRTLVLNVFRALLTAQSGVPPSSAHSSAGKIAISAIQYLQKKTDKPIAHALCIASANAASVANNQNQNFVMNAKTAVQKATEEMIDTWFWTELDCQFIEKGGKVEALLDWPLLNESGNRPLDYDLSAEALLNDFFPEWGENWTIWADWFEEFFRGGEKPLNNALVEKVVILPEQFWEREPNLVMQEIADLLAWGARKTLAQFIIDYLDTHRDRAVTIREFEGEFYKAGYSSSSHAIRGRLNELTDRGEILQLGRGRYVHRDFRSIIKGEVPDIPPQTTGLTFSVDEKDHIGVQNSGLLPENEFSKIEGVREVLLEALEDLSSACVGSNAFAFVAPRVDKYKAVLEQDLDHLSIDKLFAYGLRLQNANYRLKQEIAKDVLPEQGVVIGEAMDTVITLHGVSVLSTERGQELSSKKLEDAKTEKEIQDYKVNAQEFVASLQGDKTSPLNEEAEDAIQAVNQDIGEGELPNLSTQIAETANANLLSTIGRIIVSPAGAATIGIGSIAVSIAEGQVVSGLIQQCTSYFLAHWDVIHPLIAVSSIDLTWLEALYAWLKRQERK